MKKILNFDIMHKDRFVHTMHVKMDVRPVRFGDKIEYSYNADELKKEIETRLPSLKGKDYTICFL